MIKQNALIQEFSKKPKQLIKSNTEKADLKAKIISQTPTIKLIKNQMYLQSGTNTRETQSYANSPKHRIEEGKILKTVSTAKETIEIEKILKISLQKFKHQKQELEKVKENAKFWKEERKKRLEEYNSQTRNENKNKFKYEPFRPRTAWGSPEIKELIHDNKHVCAKNSAFSSVERRANIGLEFYNLKSPRNNTPKALQENKPGAIIKVNTNEVKKDIEEFIKKKKKELKKKAKIEKEKEEELEMKRVTQLIKIDRHAKKVIKKKKKSKKTETIKPKKKALMQKNFKQKINLKESFEKLDSLKRKSICYSEDEEVINIMQVRKLETPGEEIREGRECIIFGNFSNQYSHEGANATEIANNIVQKRTKNEKNSIIASSSMPIIELKSISDDSSYEISDNKYRIKKNIEEIKIRTEEEKESTTKRLDFRIALHQLVQWIQKTYLLSNFLSIKSFKKSRIISIETPQLSGFNSNKEEQEESIKEKKDDLELMLGKLEKGEIKEASIDEILFETIEYTTTTNNFTNNPEILPLLLPVNTNKLSSSSKSISKSLETPQNESSGSMIYQLKKFHLPSTEYLSFGYKGEVTHEDLIDSPSLMSIASDDSNEILLNPIKFENFNHPLDEIMIQNEPLKPTYKNSSKYSNPILIEDEISSVSLSMSENLPKYFVKESSLLATPKAEDIEDCFY